MVDGCEECSHGHVNFCGVNIDNTFKSFSHPDQVVVFFGRLGASSGALTTALRVGLNIIQVKHLGS